MRRLATPFIAMAVVFLPTTTGAVVGKVETHRSPGGVTEQCVALESMPGGVYSEHDKAEEQRLCAIDFHAGHRALCPKIFSTSPGTLIYDLSGGEYDGRSEDFESAHCTERGTRKPGTVGEPVSFKFSVNGRNTSATFSTASLLYYHFARYFDAEMQVPVAVHRTLDRQIHLDRVVRRGLEGSAGSRSLAMNHAGWDLLGRADASPDEYSQSRELFTDDHQQIYGVMLHPEGRRYGEEINGTRASGWGAGQNRDFQETPAFLALRSERPLSEAIRAGIEEARRDPILRKAMGGGVSDAQMVFWMAELTEITLLDFIFSQQDRIGNIDYLAYWHWLESGQLQRRRASGDDVPDDIAALEPVLIQRTQLNDNDAGGRVPYANFTKTTGMLEKIRHYRGETYRRLIALDRDFAAEGELFRYVRDTFGLSGPQFRQVVKNTRQAAAILSATCRAGNLRFDLDPEAFLRDGVAAEAAVDCESP